MGRRKDAIYCGDACGNKVRTKRFDLTPKGLAAASAKRRKHYEEYPERHILARVKHRAKTLGLPFDLTEADIQIPPVCPVLQIPIVIHFGRGNGPKINSPSLDRIRPELGYTKGNVRVISQRANLLKSDATIAELEAVLTDLKKLS